MKGGSLVARVQRRTGRVRVQLRPRSIRVRDTLIAVVISLLAFGLLGAGAAMFMRNAATEHHYRTVESAARRADIELREERLPHPIPPDPDGVDQIQVVDAGGHVVSATTAARNVRLSTVQPTANDPFVNVVECRSGHRCQLVHAIRVALAHDHAIYYVYAAKDVPKVLLPGVFELLTTLLVLALTGITAGLTWKFVGRTLAPVETIRAQLAEISTTHLTHRVPEPRGEDEIAQAARTTNQTLDRLQTSVDRQRQFSADAAHELRTPVAGLRATLEDAAMYPDDTDLLATIHTALRDIQRLESIVSDLLLTVTGTSNVPAEPFDLSELVAAEVSVRQDVKIHTKLTPGIVVLGMSSPMARLLRNLLDNAETHATSAIDVEVVTDDGSAVLTVTDDGPGIPLTQRERVFERFTRLDTARDRDSGGTGLGLAIARDIAQSHSGTLRIEDSPRGARFVLRVPLDTAS